HPAGRARKDAPELRAGESLGHAPRLAADEGAARADATGDAAEALLGALGDAAEEVPGHPAGDALPHGPPHGTRRARGGDDASGAELIRPRRALSLTLRPGSPAKGTYSSGERFNTRRIATQCRGSARSSKRPRS